jgi:hypothetical protein
VGSLRDTAARLARGSHGRTEADIQSDVRKFLLDAPFELVAGDIVDVKLEAQTEGGRRIDVEAGTAVIEVKKSLASKKAFNQAVGQLAGYVVHRTEACGQRYVGVVTDGRVWVLFHLQPTGDLAEVRRFELRGGKDALRLAAWLEPVLATVDRVRPTPGEIVRRLGSGSAAAELDLADLRALYDACRASPEVQIKRELWARLLLSALGTNFEDSDELFVTHTYLVLIAELVAHEVMGLRVDVPAEDTRALLEGQQFAMAGLHGVVEADFFDWPAAIPAGRPVIAAIGRRLSRFDWNGVEHDVLKALYESLIDADTRRKLGEYYTPDWLAQKMVDERFDDPLQQRLLDPACGSGTFLFWAVRRLLAACDEAELPNRKALEKVVQQVQGLDLHPVAVTLARVTYLLALTPERLRDRGELTVPVFLGDSVRWEQEETVRTEAGITVRTTDHLELFEQDLHFPEGVLEQPARFDRLVAALAAKAAGRQSQVIPKIGGLLNAHQVKPEDRAAVELAFTKLCRLHDAGRDHLWSYYIRNLARPLSFTRPEGHADVLVGNPPWLAYRAMPPKLQGTYRRLAEERGLWTGGKVATNQDLSDLFVARAVEQYLRHGGSFSFVMPFATLSRRQFAGFRTGDWASDGVGAHAALGRPEEFARVKPALFQVPCCVISGTKTERAAALPAEATVWRGRVPDRHVTWLTASNHLSSGDGDITAATDRDESPYRARFLQGATVVPRVLTTVERVDAGPLGVPAGHVAVRSARSSLENPPWKTLKSLEGVVEEQFVRPLLNGSAVVPFRERPPELAIIPMIDGAFVADDDERLDEYPGLAAWWRTAEQLYARKKNANSKLRLTDRLNFQRLLARQFPIQRHRVVYSASGQYMAACRVEDPRAVVEHKLYWAPVASKREGRYLCAILNSQAVAEAVAPLQSRGQHNPRDFDLHVFALAFPRFDARNELHVRLAELGERAEAVAAVTPLDDAWQFQKARRVVRAALRDSGVADAIDHTVVEVVTGQAKVPDLLGALTAAMDKAAAARRPQRGKRPRAPTKKSPTTRSTA